ncbi:translation elongation factor 1B (aEF-1B) [Archaeoglobus sulfaticallidus PM70-1]|uniref:Elongation factor 1-beta n=1 Tax=Archaeoglobus sulfaticallidus PM70-1 TaxID=387631 RepID=N0B9X4_9EURY|nr:elongation factor 1-beta [Archaeoglobus sulfaticallidus]AGK60394.1 translation elongation factor 1B (aEF-1B) [Archaeoglobus sulfaticallidus PM70-1]
MGDVVMKIKVMPADVNVDLEKIYSEIEKIKSEKISLRDKKIQPIAFGLKALLLMAVMPDEGSIGDEFVEAIKKIEGVESVEIESVELL